MLNFNNFGTHQHCQKKIRSTNSHTSVIRLDQWPSAPPHCRRPNQWPCAPPRRIQLDRWLGKPPSSDPSSFAVVQSMGGAKITGSQAYRITETSLIAPTYVGVLDMSTVCEVYRCSSKFAGATETLQEPIGCAHLQRDGSDQHPLSAKQIGKTCRQQPSTIVGDHRRSSTVVNDRRHLSTIVDDRSRFSTVSDGRQRSSTIVDNCPRSSRVVDDRRRSSTILDDPSSYVGVRRRMYRIIG